MLMNKQGVLSQDISKKRHETKIAIISNFIALLLILLGGFVEGL